MSPLLRPIAGIVLALAATSAFAQAPSPLYLGERADDNQGTTALPILNNRSGELEGFLLIEGQGNRDSALQRILGREPSASVGTGVVLPMDNGRRLGASQVLTADQVICNHQVARSLGLGLVTMPGCSGENE